MMFTAGMKKVLLMASLLSPSQAKPVDPVWRMRAASSYCKHFALIWLNTGIDIGISRQA
jgi:hypothetical protein